ncbi:HNH endonuclease [Burkholderia cepacia]|uniref:DNase/tRNase domain of colicin-like bacteriocin family protein n=1 Tax=Burkholderia cepacia TaxID=292 RepID=A0AA89CE16_BURCE|nr:HNH endonuclease [Burkholderia cepacia]KGB99172.1 DNase/tRNase domain of colicin-like bacteriocin family protein [Burkholderia cepacia]
MVVDNLASRSASSASTPYGVGGDVNAMVQGTYPVDPGKQFAWSANAGFQSASSSFDSTAASLGLSTEQALRLMAQSSSASIIDSNGPTSAVAYPVPTPYVPAVEIPGGPPLKSIPVLTETDGGFWRGLAGDRRSVFETPAPLSEKIGAGVRAVGEFIADPLIELGNQYRDVYSAASGATGGWRSTFAQQVSDGSYGGAALTELGMAAGAAPMAGAALKGLAWAAPAAGPMIDAYAARTGMVLNAAPESVYSSTASQLRNTPGIATASGELVPASGRWLDPSIPTPIPAQVSDALVGRTFNSFDGLRSAIWEQIGNSQDLNSGFSRANLAQLRAGNAPFAPGEYLADTGAFGERFNIHHVDPISSGGRVYDLSNLRIVSPKVHYDIHYGFELK